MEQAMSKEELAAYAQECARAFCRDWKVDEQDQGDYEQEAVLSVLKLVRRRPEVNKSLISQHVQWELSHYRQRERNAGFGSRHVNSPEHVSLSETVTGAYDEDGDPLTYGDTLAYEDPPQGFANPADELERSLDMGRLQRAITVLSPADQEFVETALLSGLTQEEAAAKLGVTQPAIQKRTQTIVKRLQNLML